jgi:DNA-binding HxlR family transcriptional regulator
MKIIPLLIISLFTVHAISQTTVKRDPEIKKMVDDISRDTLERYVRKLVSFNTRSNLANKTIPIRVLVLLGTGSNQKWKNQFLPQTAV